MTKSPKERMNDILDIDIESIDESEVRKYVKEIVEFEKYVSDEIIESPCNKQHKYYNPGIDYYCDNLEWDNGWHPVSEMDILRCFPEYLPTDNAIDTILKYEPILEIGAGNGYWSHILEKAGCNILSTDIDPVDYRFERRPDDFYENIGSQKYNFLDVNKQGTEYKTPVVDLGEKTPPSLPWYDVQIADHSCIKNHEDHTILSCHPDAMPWTEDMLDCINKNQKFIYIGEWYPGTDATPMFFKKLKDWDLLETFPVYDWKSHHAGGYVFEK